MRWKRIVKDWTVSDMMYLTIDPERVLECFCTKNATYTSDEDEKLHERLIAAIREGNIGVDFNNDFQVLGHWVTTDFSITQFNKLHKFAINVEYSVHRSSKYSDVLFTCNR